jgi:hypothetical protein
MSAAPQPTPAAAARCSEAYLTGVDERDADLAADLRVHDVGSEDTARRCLTLEPGGDVDALAEDVVAVDDDVAEVDADAELERAFGGQVTLGHGALHGDCALDGVDHTGELDQRPVAHGLDDAPVPRGDGRIERLAPETPQCGDGAGLVRFHHAAVAHYVRGEDRSEPSRHLLFRHGLMDRARYRTLADYGASV